jgi:hypothetical protein
MKRAIHFAGVVWLGIAGATYADQNKPAKNPPAPKPPPPAAAKVEPPRGGGGPAAVAAGGGGVPKAAPKIPNPGNDPIDRLLKMSPEAREAALEKLPEPRQTNLRNKFANFDKLNEAQKQRRLEPLKALWDLPPDKRQLVVQQIAAMNKLPPDRFLEVRQAYIHLSKQTPEDRADILARPQFQRRFSPEELQILKVLPEDWPWPAAQNQTAAPGK